MEILKDAHLTMVKEGRVTLQVPEWEIVPNKPAGTMLAQGVTNNGVSYPDDYFMHTKIIGYNRKVGCRQRAAVGREEGFLHMTRTGYNYFKAELKANWSQMRGSTWQDFDDAAEQFFKVTLDECQKHLIRLQAEVQIKNTPYNQKRLQQMQDAIRNL